ncbi:MAG: hypothetical protein WAM82_11445 [Thermoanaerobaculia bacterium]
MTSSGAVSVLRFHLAVGARLAMRVLVPLIAAGFGAGMLLGNDFLVSLARSLFGVGSGGGSAVVIAALCLGAAELAGPRICRGLNGWLRHLPASGLAHRRAATLAIAVSQVPLLLLLLMLAAFSSLVPAVLIRRVLQLAVTALAAALCVTPARRRWIAAPVALSAAIVAGAGGWWLLALGAVLLAVADGAAGDLAATGPPRLHLSARSSGGWIETRIAWRALGWSLPGTYLTALLPVLAAWAFVAHNELAPQFVRLAARLGGGVAAVLLLASLSESLAVRRPAWPWSRSLPWTAQRRVSADALFLGLHALPMIVLAAAIHPAALEALPILPLLAVRAAGALRRAPERRTGATGEILGEGLLLASLVALLPWVSPLALAGVPFALRAAVERERRQKVSRWLELHHLAAGDPQSWSAS